jgi:hypothetical protein
MKKSTRTTVIFLSFIIIGLSAGAAMGGQNCPSKINLQSSKLSPVPALSEQLADKSEAAETQLFLRHKKREVLSAEQIAAANLKCYAALHKDFDGLTASESCEGLPDDHTAHARPHKIFH